MDDSSANAVRYKLHQASGGAPWNWLFIPGGPGLDSSYYTSLLEGIELPGNVWFIDFPGSGDHPAPEEYNFDRWDDLVLPTVQHFDHPIWVGHSFSGMFPLLFPELEELLEGIVILNAAPCSWVEAAAEFAKAHGLPSLAGLEPFLHNPNQENFEIAIEALMPYFFPEESIERGREALASIPFQYRPFSWWQKRARDSFLAKWIPEKVPTLVLGGEFDAITPCLLFERDKRFQRSNIEIVRISGAGHFGWIDNPSSACEAISRWARSRIRNS